MLDKHLPVYLVSDVKSFDKYKNEARTFLKDPQASAQIEEYVTSHGKNIFPFDEIEVKLLRKILKSQEQREAIFSFLFEHSADSQHMDISILFGEYCEKHTTTVSDQKTVNIREGKPINTRQKYDEEVILEQGFNRKEELKGQQEREKRMGGERQVKDEKEKERIKRDEEKKLQEKKKEQEDREEKLVEERKKKEEQINREIKVKEDRRREDEMREKKEKEDEQKRITKQKEEDKEKKRIREEEERNKKQKADDEIKKKEEQERKRIETEIQKREIEDRRKADDEKKKREEVDRRKADDERKKKDEEERKKKEEEDRKKEDYERKKKEEEEKENRIREEMENQKKNQGSKKNAKNIGDFIDDFEAPDEPKELPSERGKKQVAKIPKDQKMREEPQKAKEPAKIQQHQNEKEKQKEEKGFFEDDMDFEESRKNEESELKPMIGNVGTTSEDEKKKSSRAFGSDLEPMLAGNQGITSEDEKKKVRSTGNKELDEIVNDPNVDNAAVKIQAVYRGKQERAKLDEKKKDNTKKQEAKPSIRVDEPKENLKKSEEAKKDNQNGIKEKKEQLDEDIQAIMADPGVDNAALKIQAAYRGKQDRAKLEEQKKEKEAADRKKKEEETQRKKEEEERKRIESERKNKEEEERRKTIESDRKKKEEEDRRNKDEEDRRKKEEEEQRKKEEPLDGDIQAIMADPGVDNAALKIQAAYRGKQDRAKLEEQKKEKEAADRKKKEEETQRKKEVFDNEPDLFEDIDEIIQDPHADKKGGSKSSARLNNKQSSEEKGKIQTDKKEEPLDGDIQAIMADPGVDNAALKIQAAYRGKQDRAKLEEQKKEKEAADRKKKEEETQRKKEEEEELNRLLRDPDAPGAATKIQAIYRGKKERAKIEEVKSTKNKQEAPTMNHKIDEISSRANKDADLKEQEMAATKIQSIYKGKRDRQIVADKRKKNSELQKITYNEASKIDQDQEKAAARIQAHYKGKKARERVGDMKKEKARVEKKETEKQKETAGENSNRLLEEDLEELGAIDGMEGNISVQFNQIFLMDVIEMPPKCSIYVLLKSGENSKIPLFQNSRVKG